jgi:endonuclease-3 related protein
MLNNSYELWSALRKLGFLVEGSEPFWWKGVGEFEVIIGVILTQQSKWENVEKSLENLKDYDLHSIANLDLEVLATLIKPSGFYNKKSKVLKNLTLAIIEEFGDFESFKDSVSREWLLSQKGIGLESADSILCYACKRDVMVVDAYTDRILRAFGYEFESYDELAEWMISGLESNYDKIIKAYTTKADTFTIYSRFHGKIVQYAKENAKNRNVLVDKIKEVL